MSKFTLESMIEAIKKDDSTLIINCLENGVNPNECEDNDKISPLHYAVVYKAYTAIKILVTWGADPLAENVEGLTPLMLAKNTDDDSRILFLLPPTLSIKNKAANIH